MPWDSVQQARWGHSATGLKALGAGKVAEYDAATKKGSLPRRAKPVRISVGDLMKGTK